MSAYTKGPWKRHPYSGNLGTLISFGDCTKGENIAAVMAQRDPTEGKANAALLLASPDLLEALTALRSFMWAEGYADQTPAMVQADAAIAKAEAL